MYPDINIGWYLDTQKCNITNNVLDIIECIKSKSHANKILFVSQCSGSLLAVKLGCIFNQYVLITNPHIILNAEDAIYPHWSKESLAAGYRLPLTDISTFIPIP